jgi:hypothetical protein
LFLFVCLVRAWLRVVIFNQTIHVSRYLWGVCLEVVARAADEVDQAKDGKNSQESDADD